MDYRFYQGYMNRQRQHATIASHNWGYWS
jgi:hypothetical protein